MCSLALFASLAAPFLLTLYILHHTHFDSSQWEDVLYEDLHRDGGGSQSLEPQSRATVTTSVDSLSSPGSTSGEMWKKPNGRSITASMDESKQMNDIIQSAGRRARGAGSVRGSPTYAEQKYSPRAAAWLTPSSEQQQQSGHYSPPIPPVPPVRPQYTTVATSNKVNFLVFGVEST